MATLHRPATIFAAGATFLLAALAAVSCSSSGRSYLENGSDCRFDDAQSVCCHKADSGFYEATASTGCDEGDLVSGAP